MSNLFKHNSRFAALVEVEQQPPKKDKKQQQDTKINNTEEHNNSFKNENKLRDNCSYFRQKENDNIFSNYNKIKKDKRKEESNKMSKEKLINFQDFPSLVNLSEKKIEEPTLNYIEKIQQSIVISSSKKNDSLDIDLVDLKPGWVVLKMDEKTDNTIIKSQSFNENQVDKKSETQISKYIMKTLVDLHEKRTKEYIDTYGYDTWEKMFKSPKWIEEELEYMSDSDNEDEENEEYIDDDEYEY